MSLDCKEIRLLLNPLQRDGTHQRERMPDALDPEYVQVDERDLEQWLLYAHSYASLLRFYDTQNLPDGDWLPFIEKDVSTTVAMIADTGGKLAGQRQRLDYYLMAAGQIEGIDSSRRVFTQILLLLHDMASQLFQWREQSMSGLSLRSTLDRLIDSLVDDGFMELAGYLERAKALDMPLEATARLNLAQASGKSPHEVDPVIIDVPLLKSIWPKGNMPPQAIPFPNGIPEPGKQARRESRRLAALFRRFYEAMSKAIALAPELMEETLEKYPRHEPHMALFLTFLHLLRIARDQINTLTKRHLDFYYREVLLLQPRPEVPDKVHLIFELAQNFEAHRLEAHTAFEAGTDATGIDLIYATDEDIIVSKARIDPEEGLKTLFLEKQFEADAPLSLTELGGFEIKNIYATHKANSLNGTGEDLPDDDPKWATLGSAALPHAEVGFAIASPMFLLEEGARDISIVLRFDQLLPTLSKYTRARVKTELRNNTHIYLSGEKEWIEVKNRTVDIRTDIITGIDDPNTGEETGEIVFHLYLPPEVPAIRPYNEAVLQSGLATSHPVARFLFDNEGLSSLADLDLNIQAGVSAFEAGALYLQGDFATLEAAEGGRTLVFRANADLIGTAPDPGSAPLVWEIIDVDPNSVTPHDPAQVYQTGDAVSLGTGDAVFRANAGNTGIAPDLNPPTLIWDPKSLVSDQYDETRAYNIEDIVIYKGALYKAVAQTPVIAPSASANWLAVAAYNPIETYGAPGKQLVEFPGGPPPRSYFFTYARNLSGISPTQSGATLVWNEIEAYKPATVYPAQSVVNSGGTLFRTLATLLDVSPDVNATGWSELLSYDPAQVYAQGNRLVHAGKYYEAQAGNQGITPSTQATGWEEFLAYISGTSYAAGQLMTHNGRYFEALAGLRNIAPDLTARGWSDVAAYQNQAEYQLGNAVSSQGQLFSALAGMRGVTPDVNATGWEDLPAYQPNTPYTSGNRVTNAGRYFEAKAASIDIPANAGNTGWNELIQYTPTTTFNATNNRTVHNGRYYQLTATIAQGIAPGPSVTGWEELPTAPTTTPPVYNNSNTYQAGDEVRVEGTGTHAGTFRYFRALGDVQGVALPGNPGDAIPLLWNDITLTVDVYDDDPNRSNYYDLGNTVRVASTTPNQFRFFLSTSKTKGVALPGNPSVPIPALWEDISSSITDYDANPARSQFYNPGEEVKVAGGSGQHRFFRALAQTKGVALPNTPTGQIPRLWANVTASTSIYDPDPNRATFYSPGNVVKVANNAGQFRFYAATSETKGVVLSGQPGAPIPPLWADRTNDIPDYNSNPAGLYPTGSQVKVEGSTANRYRFYLASGNTRGVALSGDPGAIPPLWQDISNSITTYDINRAAFYTAGERVKVPGVPAGSFRFYEATASTKGVNLPGQAGTPIPALWEIATTSGNIAWNASTGYATGDIVQAPGGVFYAAAAGSLGVDPRLNRPIWAIANVNLLPTYNPDKAYSANEYALYDGIAYQTVVALSASELGPAQSDKWDRLSELIEYDARTEYFPGDFVRFRSTIYQANAAARGLFPGSGVQVWDEITGEIPEFDPGYTYRLGEYAVLDGVVFRANAGTQGLAPVPEDSRSVWKRIRYYDAARDYEEDELAWTGGQVYRATQTTLNNKPGQDEAWEEITEIAFFEPEIAYATGDVVLHNELFYVAIQDNSGMIPGASATLWEEWVAIESYSGLTKFHPGDYVRYGLEIYRPVITVIGDDPESAPTFWRLIGAIQEYDERQTYFKFSHAKGSNGQVYRALRNVQGIAPGPDATGHWLHVPYSYPYQYYLEPALTQVEIIVDVQGMTSLILENDDGIIDPAKPFAAFGSVPKIGGNLYIGSHEVFSKAPLRIGLQAEWGDLPTDGGTPARLDFPAHYSGYDESQYISFSGDGPLITENSDFLAAFQVLQGGRWKGSAGTGAPISDGDNLLLFPDADAGDSGGVTSEVNALEVDYSLAFNPEFFRRDPRLPAFSAFRNGMARGFMRLQLKRDFLHADYVRFVSLAALNQNSTAFPNAPYTPLMNRLSLSYMAREQITFRGKTKAAFDGRVEQFFHIHPFGQAEFFPIDEEASDKVLTSRQLVPRFDAPVFNADGSPLLTDPATPDSAQERRLASGNLYIGLRDLDPPQTLHVLFQVAEGSENPDRPEQRITWAYLRKNRWIDFKDTDILADGTQGLLGSGVVKFAMPKEMTADNSILPTGMHWIRASVVDYADGVAKTLAVRPQAVLASYRNQGNDDAHLATPLPPEQISSLLIRRAAIAQVEQPYASFGGRTQEQDERFYVSVSERLRHKDRAITLYDYERLVLERFPEVYKVKCITHTHTGDGTPETWDTYAEFRPGHVKLVVVPELRNQHASDRLKPRLSLKKMIDIREYLEKHVSDFVTVEVKAPVFEEIQVSVDVVFATGRDVGFFTRQLNEDLIRFLSPWLFDEQEDIVFGGEIHASALLNFIDEQEYIDHIVGFGLFQRMEHNAAWKRVKDDTARTSTSSSVLVSFSQHHITSKIDEKCLNQLS